MRKYVALLACCLLAACTSEPANYEQALEQARAENLSHHASTDFEPTPQVIGDPFGDGVAAAQRFFQSSDTLIISDDEIHSQLRAASIAVVSHAPMVTMRDENRAAVLEEVDRLHARYVLLVGEVSVATTRGEITVIQDPGTDEGLGQLTALKFTPQQVPERVDVTAAIADLEADKANLLVPGWNAGQPPEPIKAGDTRGFPGQSKRDAEQTPLVIASPESSIAAVATARAFGADVRVFAFPDPRFDEDTTLAVAGLAKDPLIALGSQFGTGEQLSSRILMAEQIRQWLPNDKGVVFTRETIQPQWIHASTLLDDSFKANQDRVLEWAKERPDEFGLLVFEPGERNIVQQVAAFREVLALPNIGVLIDATSSYPDPKSDRAFVRGEDVTAVAKQLATIVDEHHLAQKPLLIAQERPEQVDKREQINMNFPQVAFGVATAPWRFSSVMEAYDARWHGAVLCDACSIEDLEGMKPLPRMLVLFNPSKIG